MFTTITNYFVLAAAGAAVVCLKPSLVDLSNLTAAAKLIIRIGPKVLKPVVQYAITPSTLSAMRKLAGMTMLGGVGMWLFSRTPLYLPFKERVTEMVHMTASLLISYGREDTSSDRKLRESFRALETVVTKTPSITHPHPEKARNRAMAEAMIISFSHSIGSDVFSWQSSNRDAKRRINGCRDFYWMKDTSVEASSAAPNPNDLVQIIDVDYYMDMPEFLVKNENPVILYTMQPTKAAEVNDSGMSYSWNDNNEITVLMAGGAKYTHKIWDYGVDMITVRSIFGWVTKTYLVEKRYLSAHHCLVFLVPNSIWTGIWSYLTYILFSEELTRLKPVHDGWCVLQDMTYDHHQVSIAPVNSPVSAEISVEVDSGLMHSAEAAKNPITVASVESQVRQVGLSYAQAAMLCNYYKRKVSQPKAMIYPVIYGVKSYQFYTKPVDIDLDTKPSVTAFMTPIVHGAFAPALTLSNEQRCIQERIEKMKSHPPVETPSLITYMDEFAKFVVPHQGVLVPFDEDAVRERQSRPRQKRTLDDASTFDLPKRVVKAFQKRECYGKLGDPRNISTINGKDKLEYSKLMYPFAELLKKTKWYAFGQTPACIAARVAEICNTADSVTPSDYTRLDGTVNRLCRKLEETVLLRAYAPEYVDRVRIAMRTQHHLDGYGTFGSKYETEWSRLSGSPETSTFNSLDTAFVAYVTYREMGKTPEQAWEALGIFGGDDGLTANIDLKQYEKAANNMGLILKAEKLTRGSRGVMFLARKYTSDVWTGEASSCCDILRQLMKFHTTVSLPPHVSSQDKLVEKAYSYYLTDRNTPIIGSFCTKTHAEMVRIGIRKDPTEDSLGIRNFNSLVEEDEQYPNVPHNDFMVYALEAIPHYDEAEWLRWLGTCRSLTDLLAPPCLLDIDLAKSGVVVNNEGPPLEEVSPPVTPVKPTSSIDVRSRPRRERRPKTPEPAVTAPPKMDRQARPVRDGKRKALQFKVVKTVSARQIDHAAPRVVYKKPRTPPRAPRVRSRAAPQATN